MEPFGFVIHDTLMAPHFAWGTLVLHPHVRARIESATKVALELPGPGQRALTIDFDGVELLQLAIGAYSPSYGVSVPTQHIRYRQPEGTATISGVALSG